MAGTRTPRCALVGEALADLFPDRTVIGGAPFNVARNLGALGQPALMVTRLGEDALGARVLEQFAQFGLPTAGVQRDAQRPTGAVEVLMSGREHRFLIRPDQAWDALDAEQAQAAFTAWAPDIVCFGTLAQRSPTSRAAVHAALSATPALRLLDLNLREGPDNETLARESLSLADMVKVNDEELSQVLRWFVHPAEDAAPWGSAGHGAATAALVKRFGLQRLIVTRGPAGHAAFDAEGRCTVEGVAAPVHVEDTVGAGDAFTSVCLLGLMLGWPVDSTLQRAGEFAASVCTLRGAVTQEPRFYAAWRTRWQLAPPSDESAR